ncbi:hypothetical protein DFJ73DRAFT_857174 [Zopfochytrium polystomum]|nr:hypothetical protein DFJ73DRAFT_857174 [Zopfochytrium polystomum]
MNCLGNCFLLFPLFVSSRLHARWGISGKLNTTGRHQSILLRKLNSNGATRVLRPGSSLPIGGAVSATEQTVVPACIANIWNASLLHCHRHRHRHRPATS